jgi:hypothetical protein
VRTRFRGSTPSRVLDALDSVGLRGDGRLLALNSYENRVYQVGARRASRWWSSSTARSAGATPPSSKNTPSSPNWPNAKFRWCRR